MLADKNFLAEIMNSLCEMISEIFDIKDKTCCLALVLPLFTVSVENTIAKEITESAVEFGTLDVVFKIIFSKRSNCVYEIKFF